MKKISEKDRRLHEQFSTYGKNAREWMRKCVLLLPEIEKNRIWKKKGFFSIYEYAAKLAGMSRETVNDSLRVLKKIEDKPLLKKVVEEKGIRIVKTIVNLVDNSNEKFWAEKARTMSLHTLEAYKKAICGKKQRLEPSETVELNIQISRQLADRLQKLKGQNKWENLFEQLLGIREEKLEEERKKIEKHEINKIEKQKIIIGKNILYKAKSRHIPTKIKKYTISKTNGTCAFPGCTKHAEILHHTERFAITKNHNPEKIVPLCKNHERIAHLGLIEHEDKSPSEWETRYEVDKTDYKYFIDKMVAGYRIQKQ